MPSQGCVVDTETMWPTNANHLPFDPLRKKYAAPALEKGANPVCRALPRESLSWMGNVTHQCYI